MTQNFVPVSALYYVGSHIDFFEGGNEIFAMNNKAENCSSLRRIFGCPSHGLSRRV